MRSLRSLVMATVPLWLLCCQRTLGWIVEERPARGKQRPSRNDIETGIRYYVPTNKLLRKVQSASGGGKARSKAPTRAPNHSPPTRTQTPSPSTPFTNSNLIPSGSPQSSPPVLSALTPFPMVQPPPQQAYTTTVTDSVETSMCDTEIPATASPIVESILYFRYKLTLTDDSHDTQIRTIEPILNQRLSELYLADCLYYDDSTFTVQSLSTAPADRLIPDASCGDFCRLVSAGITIKTFYILPRRRRLLDDPVVAESFGLQIRWALAQLSAEQVLWDVEFVALEPLGANDAPVFEKSPGVASAVSQSQERRNSVSWGAAVLGMAAMALAVVAFVSIRHRRRLASAREDQAGLQETYMADQERYTYDGGDGIQYLVNDELMLDADGGVEAVNGSGWASNDLNETPPPLYVQVQRSYETPDTLDL